MALNATKSSYLETRRKRAPTSDRDAWRERRERLERSGKQYTVEGVRHFQYWGVLKLMAHAFALGMRVVGLHSRGLANATLVGLTEIEIRFESLPESFDGYRILHLSDLHIDFLRETTDATIERIMDLEVDLCLMTGDFRRRTTGPHHQILEPMSRLLGAVNASDGVFATLGNHDSAAMVEPLESLGLSVLVNETLTIERGRDAISVVGLDDVHRFFTGDAAEALLDAPRGFKLAAVHSPEAAMLAAAAGFDLYLSGHTHGGQIGLPGSTPLIRNLRACRKFATGRWQCGGMQGYTSSGVGVSAIPLRYNTRAEVVLLTLRRGAGS